MEDYVELAFDNVVRSTAEAILFNMGEEEPIWIPITCIDMDEYDPHENTVSVKESFAKQEGLI